jgi:hypothetical protein
VTLSSSFSPILDYKGMTEEIGALARYFTGWSLADLKGMPVRERRHRVAWANAVLNQQRREEEARRWTAQQTMQ